jgi:hypothetical protein
MASTTPARRTTTARKRATPKPVRTAPPDGFEPIHIPADEDVVEEREPLFYIGDTEYTVPLNIPMGATLEYLRIAREQGEVFAAPPFLTRVLGEDAYTALEQARGLTGEQLDRIVQHLIDRALGRSEEEGKAGAA